MKTKLLSGLTALVLGGLTSCSNILEENGIPNSVAESGMGELRISLLQDETVIVDTKAIKDAEDTYKISIQPTDGKAIEYEYSKIKGKALTLGKGQYKISAYNKTESTVEDFEWNAPYYKTTENETVVITAQGSVTKELTCTRANSTLTVDTSDFQPENLQDKILYVKSLVAKNTSSSSTIDLLEQGKSWNKDSVCVKANIPVTIELIAVRITDGIEIPVSAPLKTTPESNNTAVPIDTKTKYQVKYSLQSTNGGLSITVKVNDKVEPVDVPVNVDPYPTQETQSSGDEE